MAKKESTQVNNKSKTTEIAAQEIVEEVQIGETDASSTTEASEEITKTTKAGKHSAKALKEAEELEAKEARKEAKAEHDAVKVPTKPRVKRYSKNQKSARELLQPDKLYSLAEAIELIPKLSQTKFDATVEVHVALGIDPRQADQQFRNSVVLPAGTGKSVRVAVLADAKLSKAAEDAGADVTDSEKIMADLAKGTFDFDMLVATPDQMAGLGRHAKVLGPKGLMPSPKSGTVTTDPAKAVSEIKKGRLDVKNDANGIVHVACGKVSFKAADLTTNAKAVLGAILNNRPSGVKGVYVKSAYIAATMTPSVKLDINGLAAELKA